MAFQPPPGRPAQDQSRKVLEEIQMQKKLLKQGATILSTTPVAPNTSSPANATTENVSPAQRQALQHAHSISLGYFVTQDSSFGNLILPGIPRLEPAKAQ